MAKIAIIDDIINHSYLKYPERVKNSMVIDWRGVRQADAEARPQRFTHASACALILEKMTDDYELFSIAVSKEMEETDCLQKALGLCGELGADIVEVSFGTSLFTEPALLGEIVRELGESGCVVTAAMPGTYDFTGCKNMIGVCCDRYGVMKPGEYVFERMGPSAAKVTVNCNFRIRETECGQSDSFSTAAITARINRYINEGIKAMGDILYCLEKDESPKYKAVLKLIR